MPEALLTVLADALPRTGDVYALGFSGETRDALNEILSHADVAFVDNADELTSRRDVVVAGPEWESAFAGLARTTFAERLQRLDAAIVDGGTLAVVVPNLHSTAQLLIATPQPHRPFDLDGGGYDATRPASPRDLVRAFGALGHRATNVHSIFGGSQQWAALGPEALELARSCDAIPRSVIRAVGAALPPHEPRVLPLELFVRSLTAADALHTAADSFLALSGGRARALYVGTDTPGTSQWVDGSTRDDRWVVGGPTSDADRPHKVVMGPSGDALLLQAVAGADMGTFRAIAERLASWVLTSSSLDHRDDLDWQDAVANGESFELSLDYSGSKGTARAPQDRRELLARAWQHFAERVRFFEPSLPWPATLSDEELVRIWLSMSGVDEGHAASLAAAAAADVADVLPDNAAWARTYSLEEASARIVALENEVSALHATLMERDRELAVRARVIRSLRTQVVEAARNRELMAKANQDIKNSAAFKLANQFRRAALITRPKQFVRVMGKAADQRLKTIRRAG